VALYVFFIVGLKISINLLYKRYLDGAFKATPIRQLETESYVPPLDLWLNGRIARFQAGIEHSGIAQKIRDACSTIRAKILHRTDRRRQGSAQPATTPGTERRLWVERWIGQPLDQWDWQEKKLVLKDWEKRWHAENKKLGRVVRLGTDPGGCRVVSQNTPPTKQTLKLHEGLRKAESVLLTQACTGKIGLAKFLYGRSPALLQQLASAGLGKRHYDT
jgi:hypothetical protein